METDYLSSKKTDKDFSCIVEHISAQTRQYAKRQFTFWRKLEREIKKENQYNSAAIYFTIYHQQLLSDLF